jgi:hypothetical protein
MGIWDGSLVWLHPVVAVGPVDEDLPVAELRAALGDDAFDASVAYGSAMTFAESVEFLHSTAARLCAPER